MDVSLKRIVAYFIDIAIVTIIVTLLCHIKFINPKIDEYNQKYELYQNLMETYQQGEINHQEYKDEMIEINYDMNKSNVLGGSIIIIVLIIYFGFITQKLDGQTIGKKIMKLKVVNNDEKKKLHIGNYLIRTIILNNILFRIMIIVGVFYLSRANYYHYSNILSYLESLMETIILLMVILLPSNRGLHDIIAGTKVIDLQPELNETKNTKRKL